MSYSNIPSILLASSSVYRASCLKKLKLPFQQASPNIDESPLKRELPEDLALRLSEQKASAMVEKYPESIIIASDQVAATHTNTLLGKPETKARAIEQLTISSAKQVDFYTGLAVRYQHPTRGLVSHSSVEICRVHFRELTQAQILYYLEQEQPYDCAGSFKSEGLGISLFSRIEVDDPNTLVGLPLIRLSEFLRDLGVVVLSKR